MTFKERFLEARDKGLPAQESWKRRAAVWKHDQSHHSEFVGEEMIMSLTTPLERLTLEDFEYVLLAGARSDALYISLYLRHTLSQDDALEVMVHYQTAFIEPLHETGCYCCFSAPFSDVTGCGSMGIILFSVSDIPPEEQARRLISVDEVSRKLESLGCMQIDDVSLKMH